MRPAVVVLGLFVLLTSWQSSGCGFTGAAAPVDGSPSGDGPGDGTPPGTDGCTSFIAQLNTCELTFGGDLELSGPITADTTGNVLNLPTGSVPLRVLTTHEDPVSAIVVHNVRLTAGASLRATGTRGFAIIASGTVTLDPNASIDVSDGGAGALAVCPSPPSVGDNSDLGAGGGGGGGYGTAGGKGGAGNTGATDGGHESSSIGVRPGPQGGCPGANGGNGVAGGGAKGLGGGALYIGAAGGIMLGVNAALLAGGGGGHGGLHDGQGNAGGGGGGSGGLIWLEAPSIVGPSAKIVANGGSGGGGSDATLPGMNGNPGMASVMPAIGGPGAPLGGAGANGASRMQRDGGDAASTATAGGGGGGGGVGYIKLLAAQVDVAVTSPAPNE